MRTSVFFAGLIALAAVLILCLAADTHAFLIGDTISTDFRGAYGSGLDSSDTVGIRYRNNWNDVPGQSETVDPIYLHYNNGNFTGATLTFTADGIGSLGGSPSGPEQTMMWGYLTDVAPAAEHYVKVENIPVADLGGHYSVIVYFWDADTTHEPVDITLGGTTFYVKEASGASYPGFVRAYNTNAGGTRDTGTFVIFTDLTDTSFTLTSTEEINGFQITPEPATLALLGLGGLAALALRRSRK